ncbi:MAG TPA: ribonuclease Y, partial [Geothermobacteraceae bacterium]|nr:ribonuclease Y [Geothermobacteraceae bacterium]
MKIEMMTWLIGGGALVVGFVVGLAVLQKISSSRVSGARKDADKVLEDGKREAEAIRKEAVLQAKDTVLRAKDEWEREAKELRRELQSQEKRLVQKEENLDRKMSQAEERLEDLNKQEKALWQDQDKLKVKEQELTEKILQQNVKLEKIASMTAEEAKQSLMQAMESEAKHDAAKMIKQIEDEAKENADKSAKKILSLAIQRYAGDFVAERTVSVVPLPTDEMKGRIIGREGRNIRAIEAATGIDLIIDDTPEAVIISGFNPVRREVARLSLERLIADGRIHPSRIEEIVQKAEEEVDQAIREAGEQATFDVGVHGIHPEIIKLLGRLKYRTSYGQNVLQHSIEVAFLCGIMAAELGLNVKQAKRAGLLHDIGKAVDHEIEGSHAVIGADLARKYGESPK